MISFLKTYRSEPPHGGFRLTGVQGSELHSLSSQGCGVRGSPQQDGWPLQAGRRGPVDTGQRPVSNVGKYMAGLIKLFCRKLATSNVLYRINRTQEVRTACSALQHVGLPTRRGAHLSKLPDRVCRSSSTMRSAVQERSKQVLPPAHEAPAVPAPHACTRHCTDPASSAATRRTCSSSSSPSSTTCEEIHQLSGFDSDRTDEYQSDLGPECALYLSRRSRDIELFEMHLTMAIALSTAVSHTIVLPSLLSSHGHLDSRHSAQL